MGGEKKLSLSYARSKSDSSDVLTAEVEREDVSEVEKSSSSPENETNFASLASTSSTSGDPWKP